MAKKPPKKVKFQDVPHEDDTTDQELSLDVRLSKDLKTAAALVSDDQARYLIDLFYQMQQQRIASAAVIRASEESGEPHLVTDWVGSIFQKTENSIKSMLDIYSDQSRAGRWAKCAPAGSLVRLSSGVKGKSVPIEELADGMSVVSFNRHKGHITSPKPVTMGVRPYSGELVGVTTDGAQAWTTPNHRWLVRLERREGHVVYLMRKGNRFRIGRSQYFADRKSEGSTRLAVQHRATGEQADGVWILKVLSTAKEALVYEEYASVKYGISQTMFRSLGINGPSWSADMIESLFMMLDATEQQVRAEQCLADHGLLIDHPLLGWTGDHRKQSGSLGLQTAAANLLPGMQVLVPGTIYADKFHWVPIESLPRREYDGPVYSMNVPVHHKYIQDGLITCNSQAGIGPVIAAGLLAHIDIKRCPSVSALWRFAGFDPTSEWLGNEKSTSIVADIMGSKGKWTAPTEDQWLQLAAATNRQVDKLKELARDEKTSAVTRASLIAALAKRPWNATLKTLLAFKLGESFVKVCNKPTAFYGQYYAQQKAKLKQRNADGQFAAAAADILTKKNFHKDTVAKQHYQEGRLPDAHIHARARREAVKLFLSNYYDVLFECTYNKKSPRPYAFEHLGHVHQIHPPHWPCD